MRVLNRATTGRQTGLAVVVAGEGVGAILTRLKVKARKLVREIK